ncbi:hypothetical protein GVY41_12135 [Frigidibacter albus]|uniref:Uncharacterized protein n=1 Tax=Frigidibacter albus TaxID=1465486 RepID=A0A6L8VJK6_9RHOB|nr:hypothetical protein [Frigidibacter albus]MZQ89876.1 hypothetical protein [Frigidibacter albus]NBE31749.1 hypothetical protein [Frigidibacter albus]GGH56203.1 hypothetical protein GCM10011341_24460 [Frigidibacter albus]
MTISQMSSSSAPAQQQGAEPTPKPEAKREANAPQQMQAAAPAPRFTDWASI